MLFHKSAANFWGVSPEDDLPVQMTCYTKLACGILMNLALARQERPDSGPPGVWLSDTQVYEP